MAQTRYSRITRGQKSTHRLKFRDADFGCDVVEGHLDAHTNFHRGRIDVDNIGDHAGAVVEIDYGVDVGHFGLETLVRHLVDNREGVDGSESG